MNTKGIAFGALIGLLIYLFGIFILPSLMNYLNIGLEGIFLFVFFGIPLGWIWIIILAIIGNKYL